MFGPKYHAGQLDFQRVENTDGAGYVRITVEFGGTGQLLVDEQIPSHIWDSVIAQMATRGNQAYDGRTYEAAKAFNRGNFEVPATGMLMMCLVCAYEKPWGVFCSKTGAAVCVECRDKARLTQDQSEIAAVKRITNQYREFDAVYDPECRLPPLAEKIHADYVELLNRVDALKEQIKIRDAAKS